MTVAKWKMQNDYISKHLDELFTPIYKEKKSRTVSHILIKMEDANKPTKKELEKVQKVEDALKKGDSFADVAKKYSDDGSASDGGYLGYMDSDTSYVDSFKNAAFKLKAGETSDWVKESNDNYNGWHLIKVEETDKAKLEKDKKAKDSLYKAIANGTQICPTRICGKPQRSWISNMRMTMSKTDHGHPGRKGIGGREI